MTIKESQTETSQRRLTYGMVGGGTGAFIGAVHRMAARLDDRYVMVAGALSGDPERARASGAALGLDPARCYPTVEAMVAGEGSRPDRIDVAVIVTPNSLHFAAARALLEAGIDVICDKPMTTNLADAMALVELVERTGRAFVLTQNNTGYPMVRQMREMVRAGELGRLRVIQVSYAQDWLATALDAEGHKQAEWRTDPARAGVGGSIGDIGVRAYNLAAYTSGLVLEQVAADIDTFVPERRLDDNAHVLLRYRGGAKGMLWASQVAPGNNNRLAIKLYGEKGGLEWVGEQPDELRFAPLGAPPRTIVRGGPGAIEVAAQATRMPAGHPEGYIEGFGNLYADAARMILSARDGARPDPEALGLPSVRDGARGVRFIEAVVESSRAGGAWTKASLPFD